jgi:hypothetical protein
MSRFPARIETVLGDELLNTILLEWQDMPLIVHSPRLWAERNNIQLAPECEHPDIPVIVTYPTDGVVAGDTPGVAAVFTGTGVIQVSPRLDLLRSAASGRAEFADGMAATLFPDYQRGYWHLHREDHAIAAEMLPEALKPLFDELRSINPLVTTFYDLISEPITALKKSQPHPDKVTIRHHETDQRLGEVIPDASCAIGLSTNTGLTLVSVYLGDADWKGKALCAKGTGGMRKGKDNQYVIETDTIWIFAYNG